MKVHVVKLSQVWVVCSSAALFCSFVGCSGQATNGGVAPSSQAETCTPSPAPQLLTKALCLCGNFENAGKGVIAKSYSGTPADVGVNGMSEMAGQSSADGSWIAYGGFEGAGDLSVGMDLISPAKVEVAGKLSVGRDLSVGGNLMGAGFLDVGGSLRLQGKDEFMGHRNIHSSGAYTALSAPPCGCDPATFFDVAAAVAAAKNQNDNAKLDPSLLNVIGKGNATATLSTGRYYFGNIERLGKSLLNIQGAVSIYVDGNLEAVGNQNVQLAPGATLDLYVAGEVETVGVTHIGQGASPDAFHLYLGGKHSVLESAGQEHIFGAIYAPQADLEFAGNSIIDGAVFAHSLESAGQLQINYSQPINTCSTPPTQSNPDAGTTPGTGQPDAGPPTAGQPDAGSSTPGGLG